MSFQAKDILRKYSCAALESKLPSMKGLSFGTVFSPHMFNVDWTAASGWAKPEITDFGNLSIPPQCTALHYAMQCFEGLKAYRGPKGEARLFRPDMNAKRLQSSMQRLCFPSFDEKEFVKCLIELIKLDDSWVPNERGNSLYIRPAAIGTNENLRIGPSDKVKLFIITTPVGPYYAEGFKPVKLLVDKFNKRAWPGGTGGYKLGANYAGPIYHQIPALQDGFSQILWLGPNDVVDEVGAMNFMCVWKTKEGVRELITAPLDGTILPGITRDSILQLARSWGELQVSERRFTIHDLLEALQDGRLEEAFGCGTAAVVTQVEAMSVSGKLFSVPVPEKSFSMRAAARLLDIQYGIYPHEWSIEVK